MKRLFGKIFSIPYLFSAVFFIALFLTAILFKSVFGWTDPTAAPTGGYGEIKLSSHWSTVGNVGIGTINPDTNLAKLGIRYNTDNLLSLIREGAADPIIFKVGTDSALVINNGSDVLTLKNEGFVGVNNTNPKSTLDINGGFAIDGVPQIGNWNSKVPMGNTLTSVDTTNSVGHNPSITIGTDGLPIIAYGDDTNFDLHVVKCGNLACSSGNTLTAIDTANDVGYDPSITIGADGLPIIAYDDLANGDLRVVKCGNLACSSGNTLTAVDTANNVGWNPSITIGTDGLPIIAHFDQTNFDLRVVKCGNLDCSSGNTFTNVDTANIVGQHPSIAIGADGLPIIAYFDPTNLDLRVAKCGNAACSSGNTLTAIDTANDVGFYPSITIGADGLPIIAYYDGTNYDLRVAKCNNLTCSSQTRSSIRVTGNAGRYPSITIGTDGLPIIAHYTDGDLCVTKCTNLTCSSGDAFFKVDPIGDTGQFTSIAIGADGLPIIAYYDLTNRDLRVAHCGNPYCIPYWTRR